MNNDTGILNRHDDSVYPGNYVSLLKDNEITNELNSSVEEAINDSPISMTDLPDMFEIEIDIPGIKREEFFIHAEENGLSVTVLRKKENRNEPQNLKFHHFGCTCFEKHIVLPENVDSQFFSAEYTDGILRLHLSKTKKVVMNPFTQIVVY